MKINKHTRIAWIIPSLIGGNYWHPVFCEFSKIFPQTIVYTGNWSGFSPGFEDTFQLQVVGQMNFVSTVKSKASYSHGFIKLSPSIIGHLYKFQPNVIFAGGFSLWTMAAVILKPVFKWKIIIAYEGSSPNVDYANSSFRTNLRRWIVKSTDNFITNTKAGKNYLTEVLKVKESQVYTEPYEVPTVNALLNSIKNSQPIDQVETQKPIFLFIGQLIERKGLELLLKACSILQSWGYINYTLMVLGQGELREQLEVYSKQENLPVQWIGWVDYGSIGSYFENADVFVLPTLEDTWGMVVLESMVFGKPVLCSQWAGASEMVIDGVNGYLFDPKEPEKLAELMRRLIDNPDLITSMGQESQKLIAQHTPERAAQFLAEVTEVTVRSTMKL